MNKQDLKQLLEAEGTTYLARREGKIDRVEVSFPKGYGNRVNDTLVRYLGLPEKPNLKWRGKQARLILWWIYCDEEGKHKDAIYRTLDIDQQDAMTEFLTALNLDYWDNHIHMNVPADQTLEWCHRIQRVLKLKSTPVFHNKGKKKYYSLYIPTANTQSPSNVEGEGIVQ